MLSLINIAILGKINTIDKEKIEKEKEKHCKECLEKYLKKY